MGATLKKICEKDGLQIADSAATHPNAKTKSIVVLTTSGHELKRFRYQTDCKISYKNAIEKAREFTEVIHNAVTAPEPTPPPGRLEKLLNSREFEGHVRNLFFNY